MSAEKTILILDDENDIHYVFDRILNDDYNLVHAHSVQEAVQKVFVRSR